MKAGDRVLAVRGTSEGFAGTVTSAPRRATTFVRVQFDGRDYATQYAISDLRLAEWQEGRKCGDCFKVIAVNSPIVIHPNGRHYHPECKAGRVLLGDLLQPR